MNWSNMSDIIVLVLNHEEGQFGLLNAVLAGFVHNEVVSNQVGDFFVEMSQCEVIQYRSTAVDFLIGAQATLYTLEVGSTSTVEHI